MYGLMVASSRCRVQGARCRVPGARCSCNLQVDGWMGGWVDAPVDG